MNCCFITFGCKVNTCETAGMELMVQQAGHTVVKDPAQADAVILNSCTVTESGDNRVRTAIRKIRQRDPQVYIVLTGCFAQAYPERAAQITEVDLVLGTKNRKRLPELLHQLAAKETIQTAVEAYTAKDAFEVLPSGIMPDNTRGFLKIQDGCNCFCSYCIIPYARGRCRSMPLEVLKQSAADFVKNGYQEIVLCGINLGFYGMEWGGSLADAVECCAGTEGLHRVRLGSLEPERLTEEVLSRLAALPGFCPQFHLSLQSGCDRTLRRMNRRYTASAYEEICERIRRYFPDCAITTDFMVGFPGETDADFAESLAMAERMQFAAMHVFRYSPRAGTRAAQEPEQCTDSVKTRRMEQAQLAAKRAKKAFLEAQVGKVVPVLFERERNDGFHVGHAPNGTRIRVSAKNSKKSLRNQIFCVKIEESDADCCYGSFAAADANS